MNIAALLFYVFSGVLLTAALMVVTTRNTVHGVLFLIVAFFNAAGLFILAGAEFLAMILVVVYVGAVAVLFLFGVMMLNIDLGEIRQNIKSYSLFGVFIGGVLLTELILTGIGWHTSPEAFDFTTAPVTSLNVSNTQALGNLLYTHYALAFQGAGLILLVAMIGAIVLTLRHQEGVRRQEVGDQQARQAKESLRLVDIPSGSGV
ncbi:MAG: NADH-quinone oxidoreductase subunit J [Alphaproteobacteria bacterium]|nr:NADH-quinone oxidoreductase subunit J [Alphaproteobacteria bacterium]